VYIQIASDSSYTATKKVLGDFVFSHFCRRCALVCGRRSTGFDYYMRYVEQGREVRIGAG